MVLANGPISVIRVVLRDLACAPAITTDANTTEEGNETWTNRRRFPGCCALTRLKN